jgi:hypothetical protein
MFSIAVLDQIFAAAPENNAAMAMVVFHFSEKQFAWFRSNPGAV